MRVNIETVQFKADEKLIDFINAKMEKLHQIFDRIIDIDVFLKLESHEQVKDKISEIKVKLPGTILIAKHKEKTFEGSVDHTVESLKRQIIKYKEKLRSNVH